MIQDILDVMEYRSGPDSCNSVYVGSLMTAQVYHLLGIPYRPGVQIANGLQKADILEVEAVHKYLYDKIEYMKAHPMTWANNLRIARRIILESDALLKECIKVMLAHQRTESRNLRERVARFRKRLANGR
jgi:hypothetical protein